MASSASRILTTHVGSLVRSPQLVEFLHKIEDRQPYDRSAYEKCLKESIETIVRRQADAGIDIVSDGEFSKGRNWAFYIHDRLSGLVTRPLTTEEAKDPMAAVGGGQDRVAFPEFYAEYDRLSGLNKRLGARRLPTSGIQGRCGRGPLRAGRRRVPALYARKDGAPDAARPVPRMGATAHRRPQSRAQRHPAGALALSYLLGQLERATCLRRAHEGHCRSNAAGECRRVSVRGCQSAPRARMGGLALGQATCRQGADSGRHQPCDQYRRTSRAGGTADRAAGQYRRARERHGRHRLRVCAKPVRATGPPHHHVGKAQVACGGRKDCNAGTLGPPLGGVATGASSDVSRLRTWTKTKFPLHSSTARS